MVQRVNSRVAERKLERVFKNRGGNLSSESGKVPLTSKAHMLDRREFLIRSSLAAAGAMISPGLFAERATEHWPPYRRSFVIAGQSGSGVDTQPMAIDVIRHIEHAIKVSGEDHVGIGTDSDVAPVKRTAEWERENREWGHGAKQEGTFTETRPDDLYTFIPDPNVANQFEMLAARLSARGHSDGRIEKILGGNFARVMREVWGS
jgi:microsomal dipeptidase-like Zn-dependent dipeptidase